jgi:hypothetical protein
MLKQIKHGCPDVMIKRSRIKSLPKGFGLEIDSADRV